MRRKILMGILAIALPIGTVAAVQSTAFAKSKPPPDGAKNCSVSGLVTFQAPGLTTNGAISSTLKTSVTTATSSFGAGCTGSTGSLGISSKNAKCKGVGLQSPAASPPSVSICQVKKTYAYDSEGGFAATGTTSILKSLKKLKFTLDGVNYQTKATSAGDIGCADNIDPPGGQPVETGFKISGTVKAPKNDKGETVTLNVCLGLDSGPGTSGNFTEDLGTGTGTIVTAAIDGNTSTVAIS